MNNYTSTIAAVSTPPGKGGVAIIRISGEGALAVAEKTFLPRGKATLKSSPRVQIRGDIISRGETIDDGMAVYFKAPYSYTGEDTVEIYCHGGALVTSLVLGGVLAAGAVLADAGEFTKRAFINGKLTLTETEAIGSLLEAETEAQIKLSARGSRQALNERIAKARASLTSTLSSIYARIDYPDEDLGDYTKDEIISRLKDITENLTSLLNSYTTGRAVSHGVRTVIAGKTNVGKSSLYNLLVGEEDAIVTDIEGTTRDVLCERVSLDKVMLRLYDTAGLRSGETLDAVEKIGIDRTRDAISRAELVFAVFDASRPLDEKDGLLLREIEKSGALKIALLNKSENGSCLSKNELPEIFDGIISISVKERGDEALALITELVNRLFTDEKIVIGKDAVIFSERQKAALSQSIEFLNSAVSAYESGLTQDVVSSEIERALGAIAELDGRAVSDEVVADIFKNFCVGK